MAPGKGAVGRDLALKALPNHLRGQLLFRDRQAPEGRCVLHFPDGGCVICGSRSRGGQGRAGPSPSAARVGVSGVIGSELMAVRDQGGAHQLAGSKSEARIASCSGGGRVASPCGTRCRVSCRCRSARGDRGQERSGGFPTPVAPCFRRAGGIKKARGRGSLRRGLSREGASGAGR